MAAAERSRSPVPGGSPVPACMFAPEPGSPGGRSHGAAAACPLRAAFGGEDGEALNGEPEIDLTSKVGPAGGVGGAGDGERHHPAGPPLLSSLPVGRAQGAAPRTRPLPAPLESERLGPTCLRRDGRLP